MSDAFVQANRSNPYYNAYFQNPTNSAYRDTTGQWGYGVDPLAYNRYLQQQAAQFMAQQNQRLQQQAPPMPRPAINPGNPGAPPQQGGGGAGIEFGGGSPYGGNMGHQPSFMGPPQQGGGNGLQQGQPPGISGQSNMPPGLDMLGQRGQGGPSWLSYLQPDMLNQMSQMGQMSSSLSPFGSYLSQLYGGAF